jgi:hypothetical protein
MIPSNYQVAPKKIYAFHLYGELQVVTQGPLMKTKGEEGGTDCKGSKPSREVSTSKNKKH